MWVAIPHHEDAVPFDGPDGMNLRWLSSDQVEVPAELLADQLATITEVPESSFAWAGGEVVAMRKVKEVLADRFAPGAFDVDGYWRRGHTDYDHHKPLEDD